MRGVSRALVLVAAVLSGSAALTRQSAEAGGGGHYQPTIESHERLHAAQPASSLYAAWLAHAHGKAGNHARARQILDGLAAASKTRYISAANIAIGYIGLGDFDTALTLMEKGFTERSQTLTFIKIDPVYDPLRADPRFVDLLRRVRLDR